MMHFVSCFNLLNKQRRKEKRNLSMLLYTLHIYFYWLAFSVGRNVKLNIKSPMFSCVKVSFKHFSLHFVV